LIVFLAFLQYSIFLKPHLGEPFWPFPNGVRCLILVDDFQQSQHTGCASNESGNDCAKNAVCFLRYFNNFWFFVHAILLSVLGSGCSQVFPEKESRKQITFVPALFRFDDDFHCVSPASDHLKHPFSLMLHQKGFSSEGLPMMM
jgi:hypothetical protein